MMITTRLFPLQLSHMPAVAPCRPARSNMLLIFFYFVFSLLRCYEFACASPNNDYILDLGSVNNRWMVRNRNGSININATVPGGIYSDLMNNNIIEEIFQKENDIASRWVAKDDWTYYTSFIVNSDTFNKNTINIVFYGLDTIANISLNGKYVGNAENMFVKYTYDVKNILVLGKNTLEVQFSSPINVANFLSEEEMIPPKCVPDEYHGECHVNQLRKMQASFSWDWGPAFPSVGIWKSINLQAYNSGIITDVTTHLFYDENQTGWLLNMSVFMESSISIDKLEGHLIATLEINKNGTIIDHKFLDEKPSKEMKYDLSIPVSAADVSMWWPNGYGEQRLYNLSVTFQSTKYSKEYFYKNVRIGFRTVELVQEPISNSKSLDGLSFYFKINDKPIFMKGTNWIPMHILPELSYVNDKVDHLLESAKSVHSNMLRVWGGGVYESDYFYEKCDELGILVWQDLMFACNMYPANKQFLINVAEEIKYNIRRLQHHPSVALWAGNNENEVALRGNWYGTASKFEHYKQEYIMLYVETIRPIVLQIDPTRQYLVSSPSNGLRSEEEGFIAENPYDPRFGDNHYYNYIQDLWSMDTYQKTRFSSEYGFQSIPSLDTLRKATNNTADLDFSSEFIISRQHHPNGYNFIKNQVEKHLKLPLENDVDYFETFVYYSQINQAMAMKVETEFYRISRFDWMTMGALYWQLNDVWQAPSWSSIEYTGRWKMKHYFARDFFSPILVSPRLLVTNSISIFVINDNIGPIVNATVIVDTLKWNDTQPVFTNKYAMTIKGLSVENIDSNIIIPSGDERLKIFYRFSLIDENLKHLSPYNYIFPVQLKDIQNYKKPHIQIKIVEETKGTKRNMNDYQIQLSTDGIGLFIWLEIPYSLGWFSDNGFILTERSKTLVFHSNKKITNDELQKEIRIKSYDPNN